MSHRFSVQTLIQPSLLLSWAIILLIKKKLWSTLLKANSLFSCCAKRSHCEAYETIKKNEQKQKLTEFFRICLWFFHCSQAEEYKRRRTLEILSLVIGVGR